MKVFTGILAVLAISCVLPSPITAVQVDFDGPVDGLLSGEDFSYFCPPFEPEDCDDGPHITLVGSMNVDTPAENNFDLQLAGVIVACSICQDGSCSHSGGSTTYSYHEWQGGSSGTLDFEHTYRIHGDNVDVGTGGAAVNGPETYRSYYCGLWLHGADGANVGVIMPSDLYEQELPSTRFALAENGVVAELAGPIN